MAVTVYYSLAIVLGLWLKGIATFHRTIYKYSRALLWIAGVKLRVEGKEKLPKGENFIYVANHNSLFDIPVVQASLPDGLRIIYKRELEKVPIWGWALRKSPYIPIERSDPRKSMESLDQALEQIRSGASVLVFPEGTRSETGELGEFKRGGFLLASRAGKRIVPIRIEGTRDILPKGKRKFSGGVVRVRISDPIDATDGSRAAERELMARIREEIERA